MSRDFFFAGDGVFSIDNNGIVGKRTNKEHLLVSCLNRHDNRPNHPALPWLLGIMVILPPPSQRLSSYL